MSVAQQSTIGLKKRGNSRGSSSTSTLSFKAVLAAPFVSRMINPNYLHLLPSNPVGDDVWIAGDHQLVFVGARPLGSNVRSRFKTICSF